MGRSRAGAGLVSLVLTLLFSGCVEDSLEVDLLAGYNDAFQGMENGYGSADAYECVAYRAPDRVGFGGRVALTFDDGPSGTYTPRVLDTLREKEVPATFFMTGHMVENYRAEDEDDSIASLHNSEQFIVGNHTYSHPLATETSLEVYTDEVDRTTGLLEAARADPGFFRFPYGTSTCPIETMVEERGMRITGWHADSADWCFAHGGGECTPDTWGYFRYIPGAFRRDMIAYLLYQLRASDGGIVLFHDINGYTAANLGSVIDALRDAGFTFTSIDDVDTFPRLNGDTEAPLRDLAAIGDACEADTDCDLGLQSYLGFCHPEGFCTAACEDRCRGSNTFCVEDSSVSSEFNVCRMR